MTRVGGWAYAAVVAVGIASSAGIKDAATQDAGDGACDPEIREGLMESASAGVQGDLAIIRDPDQGIRSPDSILDLSCLEELFDFGGFDVFYDPGASMQDLMGLLERQVCTVARNAYRGYVGRSLDTSALAWDLERLPGVEVDTRRRHFLREPVRGGDLDVNLENYRNSLGGE